MHNHAQHVWPFWHKCVLHEKRAHCPAFAFFRCLHVIFPWGSPRRPLLLLVSFRKSFPARGLRHKRLRL